MKRLAGLAVAVLAAGVAAAQIAEDRRGWIGVLLGENAEAGASPGVLVSGVVEGSPAEDAGLRARDVVVSVEGFPVATPGALIARVRRFAPGDRLSLTLRRDDREREIRVRLVERPSSDDGIEFRDGWVGLASIDLPPALREHFGAPPDAGVMIADVLPGSPAEGAGVALGDVLVAVDGRPVDRNTSLRARIRRGGIGNVLELRLLRRGEEVSAEVEVLERPAPIAPAEPGAAERPDR